MKLYFPLFRIIFVTVIVTGALYGQDVQWQKYSSKEYGYSIKYPAGWKATEAEPRRGNKAAQSEKILMPGELHKIAFTDTSDRYWQATLAIRVLELPKGKTFTQWMKEYEASDTTDFNPVEQVIDTIVSAQPAKKATLFNFDHTGQELILKHKYGVLLISYEGQNPNDKRNQWHMEVFQGMIKSLKIKR